jgi:WD40 repeat protein
MIRHGLGSAILLCTSIAAGLSANAQSLDILWSADHGAQVSAVAFSSDGTLVASGSSYAFGSQAWAKLWDAANGQPIDTYDDFGPADSIVDVAVASSSQLLAVGYTFPDFYSGYARTGLFDTGEHASTGLYNGSHVSFSGDGSLLATGGGYFVRDVYVHEVATGQLVLDTYTGTAHISPRAILMEWCACGPCPRGNCCTHSRVQVRR